MELTLRSVQRIAVLLILAVLCEHVAFAATVPDALTAHQQIARRGLGKRVKVHESNGAVLRGTIQSVGADSFVLQTGHEPSVTIPYTDVRAVDGPGLSTGSKIAITVGVTAVGVTAIILGSLARGPVFPNGVL